jgi:hypothetical protein
MVRLDRGQGAPACLSERAIGQCGVAGAEIFARDFVMRMPHPHTRRATLLLQTAPHPAAPASEVTIAALQRDRLLGAMRFDPRAGGPVAITLRDIAADQELPLRLCVDTHGSGDESRPWSRWLAFWLIAE